MSKRRIIRARSNILKLPRQIQQEIDRMLLEIGPERKTYEEITAWVLEQGFKCSPAALSRYYKYVQTLENVKIASQQVKAILDETAKDSPLELEEGVSKLGAVIMMEVLQEAKRSEGKVDVAHIGRLLGDFARLQNASVARERLKADLRKKAEKVVENIEKNTKKQLDPETLKMIREEIYGLF